MAEVAVPMALEFVKKMKIFLYQLSNCPSIVHDAVEIAKNCLEMLQSYLLDLKGQIDYGTSMLEVFLDIAHGIEDDLDEFRREIPYTFRKNKLAQMFCKVTNIDRLNKASSKLSSNINEKIKLVKSLRLFEDKLPEGSLDKETNMSGSSSETPEDHLSPKSPEEAEMVDFEEPKEKISRQSEERDSRLTTISMVDMCKKAHQTEDDEWKEKDTHDRHASELRDNSNLSSSSISSICEPSYKDVPDHLKTCFAYFKIFPKSPSIPSRRLIRMWVAEGFVKPTTGVTVEEVAEQYLNELIDLGLVHATDRGVDGRVRSCQVWKPIRMFPKKFITDMETICNTDGKGEQIRRLLLNKSITDLSNPDLDLNHIRTLRVHTAESIQSGFEMVLKNLKYLRVLDLQGVALDKFPEDVVDLTLLQYLSLRETNIKEVAKSIKKLLFLETLDVKHTMVTKLPEEISKLESLRHVLLNCKNVGCGGVDLSAVNIGALSSIQNLSLVKVGNNRRVLKALGNLIALRKLGLTDLKTEDGKELCSSIQKMENLSSFDVGTTSEDQQLDLDHMDSPLVAPLFLQRLYLKGRLERLPKWIPELTSLTKIFLKWSKLKAHAKPLKALEALPNLMELNLVEFYTGEELVFESRTFKKLVILRIKKFDELNLLKVETEAMPGLKMLKLSKCRKLELLPSGIGGLILLKELFVSDMPEKFIAKLQTDSEDRQMVQHIRVIRNYCSRSNQFKDLSPSPWPVES